MSKYFMHYSPRNRLIGDEPVRGFESHRLRQVGASFLSLAPIFLLILGSDTPVWGISSAVQPERKMKILLNT